MQKSQDKTAKLISKNFQAGLILSMNMQTRKK
jgi:hypothetical protein